MKRTFISTFLLAQTFLFSCANENVEYRTVKINGFVKDICTQEPLTGIELYLYDSCCCGGYSLLFGPSNDDCTFESVLSDTNGYYSINAIIGRDTEVDRFRLRINGNLWWENNYPLIDKYFSPGSYKVDINLPPKGSLGVKVNLLTDTLVDAGWQIGDIHIDNYNLSENGAVWSGAQAGVKNYVDCEIFNHNYTPTAILLFSDSVYVECHGDTTFYEFNL